MSVVDGEHYVVIGRPESGYSMKVRVFAPLAAPFIVRRLQMDREGARGAKDCTCRSSESSPSAMR